MAISKVYIWPSAVSLESYANVLSSKYIYYGYFWTIVRTVVGTLVALVLGFHFAYALSKRDFPNRKLWTSLLVFTMFFSGGMVPDYLLIRDLKLINSIWSLILPTAISAYNITIMRNYLMSLPDSLEESARIDGANDIVILYRIVVPLSMPILATIALWTAVSHWNAWFDGMLYIKDMSLKPLQTYLRSIVIVDSAVGETGMTLEDAVANATADGANGAKIFLAIFPIMCVYPFLQKYFAKGLVRGSVKE